MVFDQEGEMNLLFIRMLSPETASIPDMVGPQPEQMWGQLSYPASLWDPIFDPLFWKLTQRTRQKHGGATLCMGGALQ